jgi:hypothetical protein
MVEARPPYPPSEKTPGWLEGSDSSTRTAIGEVSGVTTATEQLPVSVIPNWEPQPLQLQIDSLVKQFQERIDTPRLYKFPYTGR